MRVFGIDQSYTSSGLIIVEGEQVIHAEKFVSDSNKDKPARAWDIAQHIGTLVEQFNPDIVALEGLAFGMRGDSTRDLAGLQFVIVDVLRYQYNTDVLVASPRTVKKVAYGDGNAEKIDMYEHLPKKIKILFEEMGLKKTTGMLDLSDAYYIAKAAGDPNFESEGFSKPKKKKRRKKTK